MYGSDGIDDLCLSRKRRRWRWNRRSKHTTNVIETIVNWARFFRISFKAGSEFAVHGSEHPMPWFSLVEIVQSTSFKIPSHFYVCFSKRVIMILGNGHFKFDIWATNTSHKCSRPPRNNFQIHSHMPHLLTDVSWHCDGTTCLEYLTDIFSHCCMRTNLCDGSGCADGCNGWCTLMWGGVGWLLGWCTPRLGGVPDIGCARPPCNDWGDGVIRELQRQKNAEISLR